MAIKEEAYDPGYEDAYGGAYAEGGAKEGGQSQTNGHCSFSSGEPSGNGGGEEEGEEEGEGLGGLLQRSPLSTDAPQEQEASSAASRLPDARWMTQSFADQIPDIGGGQQDAGE